MTSPSCHHIFLAFEAEFAVFARARFAAMRDIIVIGNHFGADKSLLEIGMDDAGGARRTCALPDGPGAGLFRPGGEEM